MQSDAAPIPKPLADTAFSDMAPLPVRLGPTTLPTCRPAAAATAPTLSSSSSELLAPSTPAGVGDVIDTALLQSAPGGQRYAYATLLTRDSYLPGVQALARSLAAVSAQHPLLVLHTPDTLPAAAVAALRLEPGCQPVAMQRYRPPGGLLGVLRGAGAACAAARCGSHPCAQALSHVQAATT